MVLSYRSMPIFAAVLGAVWLVTADPAHAGGAKSDGRDACREMMDDHDFNKANVDETRSTNSAPW